MEPLILPQSSGETLTKLHNYRVREIFLLFSNKINQNHKEIIAGKKGVGKGNLSGINNLLVCLSFLKNPDSITFNSIIIQLISRVIFFFNKIIDSLVLYLLTYLDNISDISVAISSLQENW